MLKTPAFCQNKTVLITAAASDISRATGEISTREDPNVIVADINDDAPPAWPLSFVTRMTMRKQLRSR